MSDALPSVLGEIQPRLGRERWPALQSITMWERGAEPATTDPMILWGTGAPSSAAPNGSIYVRKDGSSPAEAIYLRQGGAWVAAELGAGGSPVLYASGTISGGDGAGNVGDLNSAPVTLVAAPGAGNVLELVWAQAWLDFASAAYDGAGNCRIAYDGGADASNVIPNGFTTANADAHRFFSPAGGIPTANAAFVLESDADPYSAAGDSPIKWRMLYRVRTLEFTP